MAYNPTKTFNQLVADFEPAGKPLLKSIREGKAAYDEWQSFRDARTNADIATDLTALETANGTGRTITEPEVADMDAAFSAFDSIMRYLDNDTPPAGIDQGFALRVLS